jgi:chromosome partitioning protein
MRKIVIANQKGGVAKTTTAINLAWGLAEKGKRTLLIDMDPQANATIALLGKYPQKSVYDLLIDREPIKDVISATNHPNLYLVPSNIDLAGAEVDLIAKVAGQTQLKSKLKRMDRQSFDFVIIDSPPSLGYLTINSLAAADEIIIPVSTSFFAINGIVRLEKTISDVQAGLSPEVMIRGALFTLYDNTNIATDVMDVVKKHFGDKVFKTVIPRNVKVEEAHSRYQSIFTYAPKSKGAHAYEDLVEEVMAYE